MTPKDSIIGRFSVQQEDGYLGDPVGDIMLLGGLREWEQEHENIHRNTKVSPWRTEVVQRRFGSFWTGRMDVIVRACDALDLLMSMVFQETSRSEGEVTEVGYRLPIAGKPDILTCRFLIEFEGGPWHLLRGVTIRQLRFTVRARTLVHLSIDWQAAAMEEIVEDPEWEIVEETHGFCIGAQSRVAVDDVEWGSFMEVTVSFRKDAIPANVGRGGSAGAIVPMGPLQITGGILNYWSLDPNLPALVRSGTLAKLAVTMADEITDRFTLVLPRVIMETGQPGIGRVRDVIPNVSFRAMAGVDVVSSLTLGNVVVDGSS